MLQRFAFVAQGLAFVLECFAGVGVDSVLSGDGVLSAGEVSGGQRDGHERFLHLGHCVRGWRFEVGLFGECEKL